MLEKIKFIIDELDIREIMLSITHDYSADRTTVIKDDKTHDIVITAEYDSFIDKVYGREIHGKYYFARHEYISKEKPDIDYYDEFFCTGTVLNFI